MVVFILQNGEINPRFIADNPDDFGLKSGMNQKFYEEAVKFIQGENDT
jgi:hypothetical protein